MIYDQIVAISDKVPAGFSNPICIGALRVSDPRYPSWIEEARIAIIQGRRVVLAGDISDPRSIAQSLLRLIQETSQARFALLLHWTQALKILPPPDLGGHFDEIYVAIDDALTREQTVQIQQRWNPKWLILPCVGIDWTKWIPEILFPKKIGTALILTPSAADQFISDDELRLAVDYLGFQHPTITINPAPAQWFVPGEIGPWRTKERDPSTARTISDSRQHDTFTFTAIVPFRWKGDENSLRQLEQCLNSIRKTFPQERECEIVLAIDSEKSCDELIQKVNANTRIDFVLVHVPRDTAIEAIGRPETEDWRAGYVRNVGASFASPKTSTLIFIDSDVEIAESESLRAAISDGDFDLFQILDGNQKIGFESATSMFLAVRRSLFERVGGFADAFSHYGAEDNFFVWKCEQRSARIRPIAKANIRHLRAARESDDLFVKMVRLRKSGSLMYRMTLDPNVHRHFFVSLGRQTLLRGAMKRMSESILGRVLLAPSVFVLTLIETDHRLTYLFTFIERLHDVVVIKTREIFNFFKFRLQPPYYSLHRQVGRIVIANLWIFKEPTAWFTLKTPAFYKWVWRPLLKIRFFLTYHLLIRWRNS